MNSTNEEEPTARTYKSGNSISQLLTGLFRIFHSMKRALFFCFLFATLSSVAQTTYYNFQEELYDESSFRQKLQSIEDIYGKEGNFKYTKANYKVLSMMVRQDSIIQNVEVFLSQSNSAPLDINTGVGSLVNSPLPDFQLQNLQSHLKSNTDYKDKVTLINLWFTSCPPCIVEIPYLNHLKESYEDKVHFVAITFENGDKVSQFLERKDFHFEHLVDAGTYLKDDLKTNTYPKLVILDKDGIIRFVENAVMDSKSNVTGSSTVVEILKEHLDYLLDQ